MDVGSEPTIIICDFETATAALKLEAFSGRHFHKIPAQREVRGLDDRGRGANGMAETWGDAWREQKKFILSQLGDLGMKRNDVLEDMVSQEAVKLTQQLERIMKENDGKVDFSRRFLPVSNNVIWRLLTGKNTALDDPELLRMTHLVAEVFINMSPAKILAVLHFDEWIYKLTGLLGIKSVRDYMMPVKEFLEREMRNYRANKNGNYIERSLAEIEANENNSDSVFYRDRGYKHTLGTLLDLFVAGTDTTATFLEWCILYLAAYPEEQEKSYEELVSVFGQEGPLSLHERYRTHFTNALIEEMLRHSPMDGFNVPHMVLEDTHFNGYFFPKGTIVMSFFRTVHKNEAYYASPHEFNPGRFLADGCFKPAKYLTAFSLGKRRCPGEQLARAEAYLFLSEMIRKFKFSLLPGQKADFAYQLGLVPYPRPYQLQLSCRK